MSSRSLSTPLIHDTTTSDPTSSTNSTSSIKPTTNGHGHPHRNYGGASDVHSLNIDDKAVSKPTEEDGLLTSTSAATFRQLRLALVASSVAILVLITIIYVVSTSARSALTPLAATTCNHTYATGTQGMVSTTHYLATKAGLDVLKAGGNAFDAAAAIQFALNVVQPQSTGIGGGCFIVGFQASTRTYFALDGREEAPYSYDETAFCHNKTTCGQWPNGNTNYCGCLSEGAYPFRDRSTGGHPVGVPGVVRAMERLLGDYGSGVMSWSDVLQPAIQLATDGFPMYREMWNRLELNADRMLLWPASRRLFYTNGSRPIWLGETFRNPDLAGTLRTLAVYGPTWFYNGPLADEVVSAALSAVNPTTQAESPLSVDDLNRYRAVYREPILNEYRGWTQVGMSGPSSGGLSMAMMLNILELFAMSEVRPQGAEWVARLIDAQDIVWADRALYMADPDWVDIPTSGLLDKGYARSRADTYMRATRDARTSQPGGAVPYGNPGLDIDRAATKVQLHAQPLAASSLLQQTSSHSTQQPQPADDNPFASIYAPAPPSDKKGTTHLVVVDSQGNVVSMTTTIEENFGSGVVVPNRGFLLNNELTDFTATPADGTGRLYANRPQGGVRERRTAVQRGDYTSTGGKRPMSSMSPTILFNTSTGLPVLALGSPGGSSIIGTVLNGLINFADGGQCIADAVASPRVISQNAGSSAEDGWYSSAQYDSDRTMLEGRGYQINRLVTDRPLGFLEGVAIKGRNQYEGAGDYTRLSVASADGY